MNEGLEAIKRLKWGLDITQEERINLCECIEKELKQAQEDKKVLDIFKSALTAKHTYVLPQDQDPSKDTFAYAFRYLYEITQNDLDEKLRKSLREWVLKNAFPEELKEYQEIKSYMQQYGIENIEELRRVLHNNWVICQKFKTDTANVAKALEIIGDIFTLKEIVVNGKEHYCSLYDRRTHSETPLTKKEYDLLKEILP